MKLLNLKQFRELPNGVVFAKYSTCNFEEWQIKSDTWESDFLSQPLLDIDSDTFGNHVDALLLKLEEAKQNTRLPKTPDTKTIEQVQIDILKSSLGIKRLS
jgi:hypothetical protein